MKPSIRNQAPRLAPSTEGDQLPDIAQAQAATRRAPENPQAWGTFAQVLLNAEQINEARAAAQRARELAPQDAVIWTILGEIETQCDRDSLARDHFEKAIALDPAAYWAHFGLAKVMLRLNDRFGALRHIDLADKYSPNTRRILSLRAIILTRNRRNKEAAELFDWLIKEDPKNQSAYWTNLGNVKRDLGLMKESEVCYRNTLKVSPKDPLAHANLVSLMHYMPDKSREEILEACKAWGAVFCPPVRPARPRPADVTPDRPLRVGMFSDGFRQHPVGAMTIAALEHFVRMGFEIYAYSSSPVDDWLTGRMKAISARWTPIGTMTDQAFVQKLREDQLDILIDLTGHSAGTRMRAMAAEPAPIIIKWVGGLINTLGVNFFDYLITDSIESPPDSDAFYTEKLIRMPDDYICYQPPNRVPDVGPLPARRNGYVTFGCFNNPNKINDAILAQWARLMHDVPDSRLYLKGGAYEAEELRERVLDALAAHGIAAERVRLEGESQHYELFKCYNEVDIALDPWPYSGGLTTCESLLMGVPVVTLPGPTFAGRHSATHLANTGLPELVVSDWNEYVARATQLATDLDTLEALRTQLREMLLQSPVCDGAKYARHLADALRVVWQRYCDHRPPASLAFTPEGQPWFEDDQAPAAPLHPAGLAPTPRDAAKSGETFRFSFQGRVITLDHGGSLVTSDKFAALTDLGGFETIVIDPASRAHNVAALQQEGRLQHYHAHIALGDGAPAALHACLNASLSSTLEPLPRDHQASFLRSHSSVLTTLPLTAARLDDIQGLDRVDWLVLDDTTDSPAVIRGGRRALAEALVIEAGLHFVPLYQGQPDLGEVGRLLAELGFCILRLSDARYHSHFPETTAYTGFNGSQLISAKAVFIPSEARRQELDDNQRRKLAFILDAAYGCVDLAFQTLNQVDADAAQAYLQGNQWLRAAANIPRRPEPVASAAAVGLAPRPAPADFNIPDTPHMEPAGQALLVERLGRAKVFLEYGSGGSSVLAASHPLDRIYSVDSDEAFLAAVDAKVKASGAPAGRYHPVYANIGPTGAWGHPVSSERAALWPRYVSHVWQVMMQNHETPDLVLIDGRFRVASFLISAMMAPAGTVILFDDYFDRSAYHAVERFISPSRAAGRMAEFVVPTTRPEGLLPALMYYCTIPN